MKILASQLSESVLCTLPSGEQIEVTMLRSEGDDCVAEPNIDGAMSILMNYFDFGNKT